jgi:hypothetical protein
MLLQNVGTGLLSWPLQKPENLCGCTLLRFSQLYTVRLWNICPTYTVLDTDVFVLIVTVAYEVLSDPEKRKKYDQFGSSAFETGGGGGGGQGFHFSFDDMFRNFKEGFERSYYGGRPYQEQRHSFFNFEDFFHEVNNLIYCTTNILCGLE